MSAVSPLVPLNEYISAIRTGMSNGMIRSVSLELVPSGRAHGTLQSLGMRITDIYPLSPENAVWLASFY